MENLNLDYHRERLIKEALRRFKTQKEAAKALGVSTRFLTRYVTGKR